MFVSVTVCLPVVGIILYVPASLTLSSRNILDTHDQKRDNRSVHFDSRSVHFDSRSVYFSLVDIDQVHFDNRPVHFYLVDID